MCKTSCLCYRGNKGVIEEDWENYGNEYLLPYLRNTGTIYIEYKGKITIPFRW